MTEKEKDQFAVVLGMAEGFALKDAVTCLWLVQRGQADVAVDSYGKPHHGLSDGTMENAHAAADAIDRAMKPIIRKSMEELRKRHAGFERGEWDLPDLDD